MSDNTIDLLTAGELWTYGHGAAGVAAGGTVPIGMTTGDVPVIVLARGYISTSSPMTVRFYRVAWSGGGAMQTTYNRNDEFAGSPQPVVMAGGVTFTPNTPLISLTIQASSGAGNAQLMIPDDQPLRLMKNTQYVLELVNAAVGNATIGFNATVRREQASESLG